MNRINEEITGHQLMSDFKVVVADAEALLKATANQGDEKLLELRAKAEESIKVVKAKMSDAQAALELKTREVATATDVFVHKNPWEAIGVSVGAGLLIGFLMSRR